jgi:ATP-dependent helicase HrpA
MSEPGARSQPRRRPRRRGAQGGGEGERDRRPARDRRPRRLSPEQVERRRQAVPTISYPPELPVAQRRDEIAAAIRDHQVVVVAGETGSGKTTQLPKICLELGRGVNGMIGHTQPRRLAARTVATRIAEELAVELGGPVGYAVRFTDEVSDTTLVKLMTDGILLNELQRDRELSAYDTIIIDEAHERSLNIDFILGYLAQLLPRRPDLKVIVTSATIDPERFAAHFGGAPIVEVSGRTYPVEVRYRPYGDTGDALDGDDGPASRRRGSSSAGRRSRGPGGGVGAARPGTGRRPGRRDEGADQTEAIIDAVRELRREQGGDILVFLSGEREIRDTAEALRALDLPDTDILPLYARLSTAEQQRVFQPHGRRRIVLATNVAETSITVPGIRYVIDPGTARISRYSNRLKVQRLPIEPVSQASAAQRAGRCGRVAEGICIRLYAEEDFEQRPAFTEPEMLRTNLASVILQMTAIGLGDIEAFPFVDPPDRKAVADGVRLLHELGALETGTEDRRHRLTPVGRTMARLPVDPRFARMLVEADRRGCLREVLVIAAGLSIQDVRERPAEATGEADALHARFADPHSDFTSLLVLWRYLREQQRAMSGSAFRRLCRREHLNFLRVREWQDVHSQLRQVVSGLGMHQNAEPADGEQVHRAVLSGLLSHIGRRDGDSREFVGARNARFVVFPGSPLSRKPPGWVMAAELVETSRLFARTAARIEPEWAEELAEHLVKRQYSEPHWSTTKGASMVHERVTLYGLPIVADRRVPYARVDREHARELFLRHALVEDDWHHRHAFVAANRELLGEVEELEHRFRRRDLLVDADTLYRLYDARVPASVVSARHFDSWWRKARRDEPDLLAFTLDDLLGEAAGDLDERAFPAVWRQGELELPLSYHFEPGTPDDGVAVHLTLPTLNRLRPEGFDRLVPGLRVELATALIRTLPKEQRRAFVPVPEHAQSFVDELSRMEPEGPPAGAQPLVVLLADHLSHRGRGRVRASDMAPDRLPDHLRMIFRVETEDGALLAQGRDLEALRRALAPRLRELLTAAAADLERHGLTTWDIGELPRSIERKVDGDVVRGHPALVDEGQTVGVRVFEDRAQQARAMWRGTRRLLRLTVPLSTKGVQGRLTNHQRLALGWSPYAGGPDALLEDCTTAVLDALMRDHGAPVWDGVAFDELRDAVHAELAGQVVEALATVARILAADRIVGRRLDSLAVNPALGAALDDVAAQRAGLVHDGFVAVAGRDRLPDVERYVKGMAARLEKLPEAPRRDAERMVVVRRVQERYEEVLDAVPAGTSADVELERLGWAIEELRVNLFAQQLGTAGPVSEQRVLRALAAVAAG